MKLHLPKLLLTAVMATFALVQPVWADWGVNAGNDDQRNTYYVTGNIDTEADWKTADSASSDTTIYLRADEGGTAATIGKLTISDSDKLIITGKWDGSQNFSDLKLSSVAGDADNTLQIGGSQATAGEQIVTIGNSGSKTYTVGNTIVSAGTTLKFGGSNDILNFDSNNNTKQSMTVEGTLDLGIYRQTLGQGFTLTLNSGTVTGSNQKGSAGDGYGGLDLNGSKTGISIVSTGTSTISSGLRLRNNTITIDVQDGTLTIDDIVQGGQPSDIGHVNKTGSGKLIISAVGAYNEGIYKGNTTLSDGGTIEFAYDKKVVNDTEQVLAYGGTISGTGNLAKSGTGAMTIATVSGLDGDISVSGGGLTISKLVATKTIDVTGTALSVSAVEINSDTHNLSLKEGSEETRYFSLDGTTESDNGFVYREGTYVLFNGYKWEGSVDGFKSVTTDDKNTYVTSSTLGSVFYVNKGTVTYDAATMGNATAYVVGAEGTYSRDKGNSDVNINEYLSDITAEAGSDIVVKTTGAVTQSSALTIAAGGSLTIDGASSYSNGDATANPSISGALLVLNNVADAKFYGDRKISANVSLTGNTTLTFMTGDCVNYDKSSAYIWTVGTGATLDFASTRQAFTNESELILAGGTVTGVGDGHGAIDMKDNAKFTIKATADSNMSATVRLRDGATILFDVAENATLNMSGLLRNRGTTESPKGKFTKTGAGTLELSGTNTYSGGTDINAGTVKTNNDSALGTGAVSVAAGANLELGSELTVSDLTIAEGGSLIFGNGTRLTVTGTLTLTSANDIKLAEGITFDSADDVTLATGTLALGEGFDATTWAGAGTYTIEGVEYTSALKAEDGAISLTFKQMVEAPGEPISVTGWALDGNALTLNVNAVLSEGMEVSVHLLDDATMKDILGKLDEENYTDGKPMVTITLQGTNVGGTITADKMNEVVFVKGDTGKNYWGEMVGGQLMYNVERIPEPASATLSLAALMMLCARRRRQK